jgi:ABC-2 type transport system ATP-binding protein
VVQVQGRLLPLIAPPPAQPPPLAVHGLTVRFGSVTAVDGMRLTVGRGVVAALVGANGCGKTTTLRAIVGLAEPAAGEILVAGEPAGSPAARRRVAWLPDEPTGLDELTVDEYFGLVRAVYGGDEAFTRRVDALLRAFGVGDHRRTLLRALSHGSRRIVTFVGAAALDPLLLVVDEATAALDAGAVLVLREAVRAHARRGGAVLLATQDLHFAETTCDRVAFVDRGRVIAEGRVEGLLARFSASSLEQVFMNVRGGGGRLLELRRVLEAL